MNTVDLPGVTVYARLWVGNGRLAPLALKTRQFDELYASVREVFGMHPFKVYYLPSDCVLNFHRRVRIDSDASLRSYLELARPRPPLLLFCSNTTLVDSPNANPQDEEEKVGSVASSSSRGSAQEHWAAAVRQLCNNVCVACGQSDARMLDAAHLVPVSGFFSDKLSKAGLLSCYDPRNGILLCRSCHFYFDLGHWCVIESRFLVSEALREYERVWGGRHDTAFPCADAHVNTESHNWPYQAVWDVRIAYFQEKRRLRQAEAAAKNFRCDTCGKRYSGDSFYLQDHQKKCKGVRMYLFTPDKLASVSEEKDIADVALNLLPTFEEGGERESPGEV